MGLGSGIAENAWYRLLMSVSTTITDDNLHVEAKVFRHANSADPNSAPSTQVGGTLGYDGTLSSIELRGAGEVGIAASAFSTNVDSSVTNVFARDHTWAEKCFGEPKD